MVKSDDDPLFDRKKGDAVVVTRDPLEIKTIIRSYDLRRLSDSSKHSKRTRCSQVLLQESDGKLVKSVSNR